MLIQQRARVFVFLSLVLVIGVTALHAANAPSQEAPLSNADVVKLVKLQLGDDVVIAKVKQARAVAFDLTTDGLAGLKQSGVSGKVIAAMLEKTTPATAPISGGANPPPAVDSHGQDVRLLLNSEEVRLPGNRGDLSATGFWPVVMTFLDYPGLHARVRTTERRPTLVIRSEHDPTGYYYLGKLDVNEEDENNRSLKIEQKVGAFSATTRVVPAGRWHVEYDVAETAQGVWRATPRRDLQPGEYGVVVPGGVLYEFGVD